MQALRIVTPATEQQKQFYNKLFHNFNSYIEIRLIDKNGNSKGQHFFTYTELMNYQTPNNVNVYVGIYERGIKRGTVESCTRTNAIYLDFDNMELDEIMFRIDIENIPQPTMIISSGNGYHVYWTLDKPAGKEIKPIIEKLASMLNADTSATDTARVLRVPNTYNVKEEPKPCEITMINDNVMTIEQLEAITGVKREAISERKGAIIPEIAKIHVNGINNMSAGVRKGERNFCTGRIVQTLKRLNYTKIETVDIVFRWNELNIPKKNANELRNDINTYWHEERYKYDGKTFNNERLEELNKRFIDSESTFFNGIDDGAHSYDNELLRPQIFKKTTGLTFAILSIIKLAESDGIRREHLADLSKRNDKDKKLRESLNMLQEMGYIKATRKDKINYYVFTEKANYKRGYTNVSKSLHRSYIYGELKEHEYKLMILLESYAYDGKKEIYPSNQTLALRAGQTDRTIRRNLRQLEHKQFIKIKLKHGKRFIHFIYR